MHEPRQQHDYRTVTRVAQHVWVAVAFVLLWLQFSYPRAPGHFRYLDWQIYCLYFLVVAGFAARYATGIRYGHERWHRIVFDGFTVLFMAIGVNWTGGIRSDLWLIYLVFVIAETLVGSARGFLLTDAAAVLSYVVATWPRVPDQMYAEQLVTRIFFMGLVASIARTVAAEERRRQADLGALREELSVSEERRRLARDLHDGIGHTLTRVILSLEVAKRQCAVDPAGARPVIEQQADALREAMEEMRQIVATLRTDTAAFDLNGAIRAMTVPLAESGSLVVEVETPDRPVPLSVHRQYHLSRVVQEALTNCMRHARVQRARVEVRVHENPVGGRRVVAVVSDEGVGFDPDNLNGARGHGLEGMRERLAPYEGRVTFDSAPGKGTRVVAEVPADVEE